jgi:thiol:disulfide interchange protein DsbD
MSDYHRVKVDLSRINTESQALMSQYQIFGMPSVLFLDQLGNEPPDSRLVALPKKSQLLERLAQIKTM